MYLVFDIGGTNMRLANSFDGENFQEIEIVQTPQEFDKALDIIQKFIWHADSTHPDNLFCIGLPGVLDIDKKTLVAAPHLPLWVGKPVAEKFNQIAKTSVLLSNDADMAGLGEAVKGAGKDFKIVAYITVGTGIGGVRVINKKIDISKYGFEPGHQIIDFDGSLMGSTKDWEAMAGGVGIKNRYNQNAEDIKDEKIWSQINNILAIGLVNTIVHWSPDIVILGGSVAQNNNVSTELIETIIKQQLKVFPNIPIIKKAELGEKSALIGGIELLKSKSD
jgi:predicted NBD/HSP70 family sugar kinase